MSYVFRPGDVVHTICSIYVNFKDCDSFLSAVSQDGRSYSQDLFKRAENVLLKVGKSDVVADLQDVAQKVGIQVDQDICFVSMILMSWAERGERALLSQQSSGDGKNY